MLSISLIVMFRFTLGMVLGLFVAVNFWSCEESSSGGNVSPEDVAEAETIVNEAGAAMEGILDSLFESDPDQDPMDALDFSDAYQLYIEAQVLNPNNDDANFGVAMTGLMQITQDESFPFLELQVFLPQPKH